MVLLTNIASFPGFAHMQDILGFLISSHPFWGPNKIYQQPFCGTLEGAEKEFACTLTIKNYKKPLLLNTGCKKIIWQNFLNI